MQLLFKNDAPREKLTRYLPIAGILILFLVVNFIILPHAIQGLPDSQRYLINARYLLRGKPLIDKGWSYIGYILIVAAMMSSGTGLYGVAAIQLLAALVCLFVLYDLGRSLGGHWAGVTAALLFAADAWLASWNFLILTEALYAALVLITVWAVYRAVERGGWNLLLCVPALALVVTVRPNGWIMLLVALIYGIYRKVPDLRRRWFAIAAVILGFGLSAALVPAFRSGIDQETPVKWLGDGITMWGEDAWRISMPADPVLAEGSWKAGVLYGLHHPLATATLVLARLFIYFSNLRPDVSVYVNAAGSIWLVWIYVFAVMGFIQYRKHPLAILAILTIAAHTGIVALTFVEGLGRFLLYILPLFYLFCGAAVARFSWTSHKRRFALVLVTGVIVAIIRLTSEREGSFNWVNGDIFAQFGDPSPQEATLRSVEYASDLRLAAFSVTRVPRNQAELTVTMYWQSARGQASKYRELIKFVDAKGRDVGSIDDWIGAIFYKQKMNTIFVPSGPLQWCACMRTVDRFTIIIPDSSGRVSIYLEVYVPDKDRLAATAIDGKPTDEQQILLQTIDIGP